MSMPTRVSAARSERVLIADDLSSEAVSIFTARGFTPEVRVGLKEDQLVEAIRDVDALLVRSATKVTRRVLQAAPKLSVVGRAGVGVDNVDVDAATERGVVVMNAPAGNTTTTAELAIALLVALSRNLTRADRAVRAGEWKKRSSLIGSEVTGKTLGVVGLGRIGRAVAQRARGLELDVIAHDPFLAGDKSPVEGVELVTLAELLAKSDFVTLHVPFTDTTRNLLSRERLFAMKRGARLINAARGGLVDEKALVEALESGHLRGAALDVFEKEPPPADHPLLSRDDVILTPHLGASSEEAQRNVAVEIAEQVCDFLLDGVARNAVNLPPVSAQTLRELAPYVLLAEKLGSFLSQVAQGPIDMLDVSLSGEVARKDAHYVALAVLVGVLRAGTDTPLNFVNAPTLAKERGVRFVESQDNQAHFLHSLIKARAVARGTNRVHVVAGSVFGRTPRIVQIDEHHLDLSPSGPLIVTTHVDQPGVVGLLGTVLGKHGVNIKKIELGPSEKAADGLARGFLSLYDAPARVVIDELAGLAPVRSAQLVQL